MKSIRQTHQFHVIIKKWIIFIQLVNHVIVGMFAVSVGAWRISIATCTQTCARCSVRKTRALATLCCSTTGVFARALDRIA